ncbi:hypothetical protein [Bifidobacterium polysaccharolyticum]|uniref:hypothetical protein n=1 Tax=Bifidobacterium polysaccharolyticum TaxID=2750967 RepID=UPI00061AE43E|nr:hypothetical protein JF71_17390 [Bifidobacterium asteroides]
MALKDKVVSSVKAHFASLNLSKVDFPDVLYNYVSVFSILLMVVDLVLCGVDAFRLYSGMAGFYSFVYILWLIVNILFFYGASIAVTCVSISHEDDRWKSDGPFYLHFAYIMCLMISLLVLGDATSKNSKASPVMQDQWAAGICLIFLEIVELTTAFLFASDTQFAVSLSKKGKKEWDPAGRWWIRTVPYAILGMIFLVIFVSAILFGIGGAGYSMFYSVAVSVLAVNYLVQIINERIVPKEGPYKKTHPAVDADQRNAGEGVC